MQRVVGTGEVGGESHRLVGSGDRRHSDKRPERNQGRSTVLSVSGTPTVSALVEESNDLENWSPVILTVSLTTGYPAFMSNKTSSAATMARMAYVRVRFTTSSGTATVTAGVDLYKYVT